MYNNNVCHIGKSGDNILMEEGFIIFPIDPNQA